MSIYYQIQVDQPATKTSTAKSWTWTPNDEVVESLDVELKAEGKRISSLEISLHDPRKNNQLWPIGNSLPDPAFSDIPLRCYLPRVGDPNYPATLVFDGKITAIECGWPGDSKTRIVAHDRSIDLRTRAMYRTVANKTSVQLASWITQQYGYTVDTSELGSIVLVQRLIDMGIAGVGRGAFSEWNHIVRALAADGLELYVKGKTVKVRKNAQVTYPHTFQPDDGFVISFRGVVNHVSGPGEGGQSKMPLPAGNKGTKDSTAASGANATEASAANAPNVTHRTVPQGPSSTSSGVHTEGTGDNAGPSFQRRKRKDEATLTTRLLADVQLKHLIALSGYGAKWDGNWHATTVRHSLAGRDEGVTTISMSREPSNAGLKGAGAQPLPAGSQQKVPGSNK